MRNAKRVVFYIFLLWVSLPLVSAWRSQLFPEDWKPLDAGIVDGVNRFYNTFGTINELGNVIGPGHPMYHPYMYLHDFSYAGYRRGEKPIPSEDPKGWTQDVRVFNVKNYGCIPDGKMDCRAMIQGAIDDAGNAGGGIVYLPEGEYRITDAGAYFLRIRKSNIVLRGDGVGKTKIKVDPFANGKINLTYENIITIDGGKSWRDANSTAIAISQDLLFPTKKIPVADVSLFKVGDPIVIQGTRTPAFLKRHDMIGIWSTSRPAYLFRRKVVGVDSSKKELEIDAPLKYEVLKEDSPTAAKAYASIEEIGLEDFSIGQIRHPDEWDWSGDIMAARDAHNPPIIQDLWQTRLVKWNNVENAWMIRVGSYRPAENAGRPTSNLKFGAYDVEVLNEIALLSFSRYITIRDVYFKNAQVDEGSANGYAFRIEGSESLLENVTVERFKKGFAIENSWASGNVIKDSFTNMALEASDVYHWELSPANLVENHVFNGSYWKALVMNTDPNGQGHGSSQSVFWNIKGLKGIDVETADWYDRDNDRDGIPDYNEAHGEIIDEALVISAQYGWGYVIGTYGPFSKVLAPRLHRKNSTSNYWPAVLPQDWLEGEGYDSKGLGPLEPRSLYEAQLALRLGKNQTPLTCVDNDKDGYGKDCSLGLDCNDGDAKVHALISCAYNGVSCGSFSFCAVTCLVPPAEICGNSKDEDCDGVDLVCPASGGYTIPSIGNYYLEAERYNEIHGTATVLDDADASQLKSVIAPDKLGTDAWTTFVLNLKSDASFLVWVRARGIAGDYSSDSVYVSFDGGVEYAIYTDRDFYSWKKYSAPFPLTSGEHILKIRAREDGVRWDKILLTTDSLVAPSGLGGEALVPSGNISINETPRLENSWLEFLGNGHVEIPDSDALSVGKTKSLSFSLYVRNNNDLSSRYLLGKGGEYGIRTNPIVKNIDFYTWNASGATQQKISTLPNTFQNSQWAHLGFSHEEGVMSLSFTNGIFQGSDASTGAMLLNGNNPLTIGSRSLTSTDNFNGSFADLRIYSKPIYSGGMATLYEELSHENLTYIPIISLHQYVVNYSGTDSLYVNENKMRELLELLNSLGYSSITDVEYYEWTQGRRNLPEKPVILTWDDGFDDIMDAAPLMAQYGYKGVAALITGWVGKSGRVTWDDVNTLVNVYNWTVASHTLNHCDLVRTCNTTQTREGNLSGSRDDIIKYTGKIPLTFVHPFNSWNTDTMRACAKYYKMCIGPISPLGMTKYITQKSNLTNGDLSRSGVSVNSGNQYLQRSFNFTYNLNSMTAHYTFDEGSGNILHDSSGNGHDGTISNAFWRTV